MVQKKVGLIVSSLVSVSIQSLPCFYPRSKLPWLAHPIWDRLHVLGGRGTSDNLDQLASNDGLSGSVEENLVLVDHLSGVLGGVLQWNSGKYAASLPQKAKKACTYVHGISAGRDFASVALGQTPVDGVGEGVLPQVGQKLLIDLESREVF